MWGKDDFQRELFGYLHRIEHLLRHPPHHHKHQFGLIMAINQQGKIDIMATNVTVGWTLPLTAKFFNATDGTVYPLAPGTIPVWSASSTNNVTLTPAADGLTCSALGTGAGAVVVTCVGQGDPVAGVDDITATITITVQNPEDTTGTITAGTATPPVVPAPVAAPASASAP